MAFHFELLSPITIAAILAESPTLREAVAASLVNKDDIYTALRNTIRKNFDYDHRIAAIKYVRQFGYDNKIDKLTGLINAKHFVDEVFPPRGY